MPSDVNVEIVRPMIIDIVLVEVDCVHYPFALKTEYSGHYSF